MTSKTKVDQLKEVLEKKKEVSKKKEDLDRRVKSKLEAKEKHPKKGEVDLEGLTDKLNTAEEEAKAHYDKLLRAMAELDNFKKRTSREKEEMFKYSNEQLMTDLLPVLDDMDRVLEHVPEGASKELKDFVSGVEMAAKQFLTILGKYGLSEVEAVGQRFDPEQHEAVAHIPNDDVNEDYVIEQHRKGYILKDRLIRPAMVSVSKGKG